MKKSSWFIFFLILAVSCLDDPDCFRLNNNWVGVAFRVIGSTELDSVRLTTVEMSGASGFYGADTVTTYYAPVNFTTTSTRLTYNYVDGQNTYLDLEYVLKAQFISDDCGSRYELSDLIAKDSNIDSVRIINGTPSNAPGTVNVELFRCPKPSRVGVILNDVYLVTTTSETRQTIRAGTIALDSIATDYSDEGFYQNTSRTTFYLPLDLDKNTTTFTFNERGRDEALTLTLDYVVTPSATRYPMCGEVKFIEDLKVSAKTGFARDTLALDEEGDTLDFVADPPVVNVRLFRCQRPNLVRLDFKRRSSATSENLLAEEVFVKSIKANYTEKTFFENGLLTRIVLPVDETQNTTTFYIEYEDGHVDTVGVSYTRSNPTTTISVCGPQRIFSGLQGVSTNASNIRVARLAEFSIFRFPATTTNIEVISN
jgi:hypothetical protein